MDELELATAIYRDLLLSSAVTSALADGEDPAALHEQIAERALMAAATFADKQRQLMEEAVIPRQPRELRVVGMPRDRRRAV